MKLADLERHLRAHGCALYREASRHAVWWNPITRKTSAVPRHREIKNPTEWAVCKAREIPKPRTT